MRIEQILGKTQIKRYIKKGILQETDLLQEYDSKYEVCKLMAANIVPVMCDFYADRAVTVDKDNSRWSEHWNGKFNQLNRMSIKEIEEWYNIDCLLGLDINDYKIDPIRYYIGRREIK